MPDDNPMYAPEARWAGKRLQPCPACGRKTLLPITGSETATTCINKHCRAIVDRYGAVEGYVEQKIGF